MAASKALLSRKSTMGAAEGAAAAGSGDEAVEWGRLCTWIRTSTDAQGMRGRDVKDAAEKSVDVSTAASVANFDG